MKILLSSIFCCFIGVFCGAQTQVSPKTESKTQSVPQKIFVAVEIMPEFIGGETAMNNYISSRVEYPQEALENKLEGVVYISYVVRKDGSIDKAKIVRDIGMGCGKEALRVIKGMPKWRPGRNNGKPVDVEYTIPVQFISKGK